MKKWITYIGVILISALLLACGGGGGGGGSSGGGSSTQTNVGKFAYVPNYGGDNISGFSINQSTGALTAITGSPFAAGSLPRDIAVTPSGKFAYAVNNGSRTISQYSINAVTGALTNIAGFVTTGSGPVSILVEPTGKFAYVANQSSNSISSYSINSITGALTDLDTTAVGGSQPTGMTINVAGTYLYTVNIVDSTVSAFSINSSTGVLTPVVGSPFATGAGPRSIVISPSGGFAYVAGQGDVGDPATAGITIFPINPSTGALLSSTSFISGFSIALAIDPTGQYLYSIGAGIDGYSINSSTGLLSALTNSPFTTGSNPISISIDPSGQFVYVPQIITDIISAFTLNSSSGQLTASGDYNAGPGLNVITITSGSR